MIPLWIREKPLRRALDELGPTPGIRNPYLAGAYSFTVCAFVCVVFMMILSGTRGASSAMELFEASSCGVIGATGICGLIYAGIFISSLFPQFYPYRLKFAAGEFCSMAPVFLLMQTTGYLLRTLYLPTAPI
ncbi:MAG: hypothetical protein AAFY83_07020 [Pseudomonadota bacterium]